MHELQAFFFFLSSVQYDSRHFHIYPFAACTIFEFSSIIICFYSPPFFRCFVRFTRFSRKLKFLKRKSSFYFCLCWFYKFYIACRVYDNPVESSTLSTRWVRSWEDVLGWDSQYGAQDATTWTTEQKWIKTFYFIKKKSMGKSV